MLSVGMPLDGLQKFASKHGITGCRCMKKLNLCQTIVVAKGKNKIAVANRTTKVTNPRTSLPACFATLSFIRVLFEEEIWPLLANRGKILDRSQLQDKPKTYE
eukprot:9314398-Ditylum_brightwellii.AAC.1